MTDFGGLGGAPGGRDFNHHDLFEVACERAFGQQLRAEGVNELGWTRSWELPPMLGQLLYGSITNQDWKHENGDTAGYSFRAAGDLIAGIIGEGDYMDWYCTWSEGVVDDFVAQELGKQGWTPIDEEALMRLDTTEARGGK